MDGKRLAVARQRKGYTRPELADLLGVTPRTIGGWEAGTTSVPVERQAAIASVLGFSKDFFRLGPPASVGINAVSFRSLSRKSATQRDAALAMCDLAVDLAAWLDQRFGRDKVDVPDLSDYTPEVAATLLRRHWSLGNAPISNLTFLLEAKGVRVFGLAENCREIDACSFWLEDIPYILVDTSRSAERIRFNLAHEIAHLVLHRQGAPIGQMAEKEANNFASEFLMTLESLQRNMPVTMSLESLIRMKGKWGVSVAALAYRLNKVGYVSDWQYKSMVIEMRRREYHVRDPQPCQRETSYVLELILKTLSNNEINLRRVSDETSIPVAEIVGLFEGLAPEAISLHDIEDPEKRRARFRVV